MRHKGVIKLKPSSFQLINKPRVIKNIFQFNTNYNLSNEILLEIDKDIEIKESPNKKAEAMVILNLIFFKDKDFKEVPFKFELEIEGLFGWEKTIEDNPSQLESLLKENAPAILYSYLRPIVTAASIDANLPPLVIPLMNFRQ